MVRLRDNKDLKDKIFSKTNNRCFHCGKKLKEQYNKCNDRCIDHIIQKFRGGTDDPENLIPTCRSCNASRGTMNLYEYRLYLLKNFKIPRNKMPKNIRKIIKIKI